MGLHGEIGKNQVNEINETVATFETAPVEFRLKSMNGQVNIVIEAFTINNVTGDLKTVNWKAIIETEIISEVLISGR